MESILEANADNWEQEILQSDTLTLVEFWHHQCPWCIRLEPILNEVAEEYKDKIRFTKIDVLKNSENREISIHYGVMGTPTLVFFCYGRPLGALGGFMPKEHLKHILDDMIEKYRECIKQSTELKI